jgi:hypothetical protein
MTTVNGGGLYWLKAVWELNVLENILLLIKQSGIQHDPVCVFEESKGFVPSKPIALKPVISN